MPIDLMSPIQALESATLKLVAKKESDKHLELKEKELKIKQQKADTYAKSVANQMTPEQKIEHEKELTKQSRAKARQAKFTAEGLKYRQNSSEMASRAQEALNEEQENIRNNQVNLGGE